MSVGKGLGSRKSLGEPPQGAASACGHRRRPAPTGQPAAHHVMAPGSRQGSGRQTSNCATRYLRKACSQGSHPGGRPLTRPAVGSRFGRRRAPDAPGPFVYDVFWLLSFGLSMSAPAPDPQTLLRRVLRDRKFFSGAPASLISYADFSFPGPAGGGGLRRPRASKLASSQKQRGERGSWPVTHRFPPTKSSEKDKKP
jgi:hypothetical protein